MTRAAIVEAALQAASRDGLEGLTIGTLADSMQMSKSGVFAHFGSREELQLAVLKAYVQRFVDEVLRPVGHKAARITAAGSDSGALGFIFGARDDTRLHHDCRRGRVRRRSWPAAGRDGCDHCRLEARIDQGDPAGDERRASEAATSMRSSSSLRSMG